MHFQHATALKEIRAVRGGHPPVTEVGSTTDLSKPMALNLVFALI